MTCVWYDQNFYVVQTYYMWQEDKDENYVMDTFKSTLDITLFTRETPKLFLKQKYSSWYAYSNVL